MYSRSVDMNLTIKSTHCLSSQKNNMAAAVSTASEDSIEFRAFTELYHRLTNGIKSGLIEVCLPAFSKHLFPSEVKSKVLDNASLPSTELRANIMLEAIHNLIKNRPSTYNEFADILGSIPSMKYLADEMKQKKEKLAISMDRRQNSYLITASTKSTCLDSGIVERDSTEMVVTDLESSPDPIEPVVEERKKSSPNEAKQSVGPDLHSWTQLAVPIEDQQRQHTQNLWEHFIEGLSCNAIATL